MSSPELAELIAAKRADPYTEDKTIKMLRAEAEGRIDDSRLPPDTRYSRLDAGGVEVEWIESGEMASGRVFFFIHGGGYYRGSVASSRFPAAAISAACHAPVCSVEYRLAPEHPFPAAIDDVLLAYEWLLQRDFTPAEVVVGGISAGGGLTAALLLALKQAGREQPAGAAPLSPWLDLTQSAPSYVSKAEADPIITKPYLDRMAAHYLAGGDPRQLLASPLFGDLSGLAPQLVQVGSAEVLLDDSLRYVSRLAASDVWVALEVWDGLVHGWHGSPGLPEALDAIDSIARFTEWAITRAANA